MTTDTARSLASITIDNTLTLNDIAAIEPRALEVFARHGLDACCGGAKTLALVCERHQLSFDDLVRELRELTPQ